MIYLLIYTAIAFTVAGNLTREVFQKADCLKDYIYGLGCVLYGAVVGPPCLAIDGYRNAFKLLSLYLDNYWEFWFWKLWYFNRKSPKLKKEYWDMRAWKIRLSAPKVTGRHMKKKVFNKLAEHNGFNDLMY